MSKFLNINHGFFNKNGGVSKGVYKSLNCGIGSNDKKANIKKNLKIVKRKIGKKSKAIFFVKQVHSNKFIYLNKNSKIKNKSVNADAIEDVFNYLKDVKEETICFVNACAPLLNLETLNEALQKYIELKLTSLTTVLEKKTWYFDSAYKPINDNSACNTKVLSSFFECTHNFHIFKKEYFTKNKKYWSNKKNDPYLFNVNLLESLDIDTEEEFIQVEKIYTSTANRN